MFVTRDRVPITLGENTIYILPKMDLGTKNRLMDELTRIEGAKAGSGADVSFLMGRYMMALAEANIIGWEGPDFEGTPCTPANIQRLDPDEPLVDEVIEEIGRRNPMVRRTPEKNS
jgi:hypothetical protein